MNKDFQQEELENFIDGGEHYSSYSLPPRSTIHGTKETDGKRNGMKIFWAFIFISLIISAAIYFIFIMPEGKNLNIFGRENNNEEIINNDSSVEDSEKDEDVLNDVLDSETETETEANTNQEDESNLDEQNNELIAPEVTVPIDDQLHIVKSGENLFRISMEYYNTGKYYEALAKYNGLQNSNDIYAGFKLKIPSKEVISQY